MIDAISPSRGPVTLVARWLVEGARTLALRPPRLQRLTGAPLAIGVLTALLWVVALGGQRLLIAGDADFYPPALQYGWWGTVAMLGLCGWVAQRGWGLPPQPGLGGLFALVLAQDLWVSMLVYAAWLPWMREPAAMAGLAPAVMWALYLAPVAWTALAQCVLLARRLPLGWTRLALLLAIIGLHALQTSASPPPLWIARAPGSAAPRGAESTDRQLQLTDEVLQAQPRLIDAATGALEPQRPGVIDIYSIVFAPYGDEDVFRRESAMVDGVMRERFGAQGRSLQLVNHPATATTLPWATVRHLQQAIDAAVARMDPAEDVLFIHFTSHGGRDGVLASDLYPLTLQPLDAATLRGMLDKAGVRWRVLSISACFSGSWIAALQSPDTLVMTAADARHTSYGCGRKSELTFFGRAMFDEQLRSTFSFQQAHAAAREVIAQREREAGKDDGYSNPQIVVGEAVDSHLQRLVRQLEAPR